MKKSIFILAAMMLLGVQYAGAWGFQAEGWTGYDSNFQNVQFYANGYDNPVALDIYTRANAS